MEQCCADFTGSSPDDCGNSESALGNSLLGETNSGFPLDESHFNEAGALVSEFHNFTMRFIVTSELQYASSKKGINTRTYRSYHCLVLDDRSEVVRTRHLQMNHLLRRRICNWSCCGCSCCSRHTDPVRSRCFEAHNLI